MYIACSTWPDIAFAVECLSQNIIDPQAEHIKVIKQVMQYLKGTTSFDLMFKVKVNIYINQFTMILYSYLDSNYTGDIMDQRSTIRYVFMLNSGVVT